MTPFDMALADLGRFSEALALGPEAIRIAEALDHAFSLILAYWAPGYVRSVKGELEEAVRLYERALAIARDRDIRFLSPLVMAHLGDAYVRSGRVGEGLSLISQALETFEATPYRVFHSLFFAYLGHAHLVAGKPRDALRSAERSLELARSRGERGFEAQALRLLGEIAAQRDPPDEETASSFYSRALALAGELGMRPLVAHCHLGLGTLAGRNGKREEVHEHLGTAATMYREMEMQFWLDRAEAARRHPRPRQ